MSAILLYQSTTHLCSNKHRHGPVWGLTPHHQSTQGAGIFPIKMQTKQNIFSLAWSIFKDTCKMITATKLVFFSPLLVLASSSYEKSFDGKWLSVNVLKDISLNLIIIFFWLPFPSNFFLKQQKIKSLNFLCLIVELSRVESALVNKQ